MFKTLLHKVGSYSFIITLSRVTKLNQTIKDTTKSIVGTMQTLYWQPPCPNCILLERPLPMSSDAVKRCKIHFIDVLLRKKLISVLVYYWWESLWKQDNPQYAKRNIQRLEGDVKRKGKKTYFVSYCSIDKNDGF